ncbi:MAG: cation-translocating P-type ATPase, partial [Acetanaerobacterium sp.]
GFAYKNATAAQPSREDEYSLVFVGMAGMIDPPRREVYDAIRQCRRAGIRPVMITGDHLLTASAIAGEIKLLTDGDEVLSGEQLDAMDEEALIAAVGRTAVYARVTPAHKLRIVRALKKTGQVVAMTGDGVNDAPAVKEADIGVAMGINGTDVTREAASLILLDDNFATLISAVEEGRVIYQNIRKFIRYLLSCNIGEVATMFVGMLMGLPVVLLPIQILLVNLVTDGLPAIALGLEPPENDEMTRKPRGREESIFSNSLTATIVFRGCLIGLATLGTFVSALKHWGDLDMARSAALMTLIVSQLIHVFECKSEKKSLFRINIFSNAKLVLAVLVSLVIALMALYWQPMATLFHTHSLSPVQLLMVLGYSFTGPVIAWFIMSVTSRKKTRDPNLRDEDSP